MASATSPFHRGERAVQDRLGVRERVEQIGRRFIRGFLPDEHRSFYEQLPYLVVGSVDARGRPWASMLVGAPGFVSSNHAKVLDVRAGVQPEDPLRGNIVPGARIGVLGIDYAVRRRNRLSGRVVKVDDTGFQIAVDQTFGNCPKFIQTRSVVRTHAGELEAPTVIDSDTLGQQALELIAKADHFFIATIFVSDDDSEPGAVQGADVSHRGGKPGFVRAEGNKLTFPDFSGNNHFNTIGNMEQNPLVGLLFVDFETRDLLFITGTAEVVWDGLELDSYKGAERLIRVRAQRARFLKKGFALEFEFGDYSPFLEQTGSWAEAGERRATRQVAGGPTV